MENIRSFQYTHMKKSVSVWIGSQRLHMNVYTETQMEKTPPHTWEELQEAAWKKEKPEVMNH